jgi:signal transduction histidine kinase
VIVGVIVATPGVSITNAGWSVVFATPVDSLAGTAAGCNEARVFSRARDVERATQDLGRTVEQLEASNERLDRFANAAAHDLQEPLRTVLSYLRLIEDRADDELTEEIEGSLEFPVNGAGT